MGKAEQLKIERKLMKEEHKLVTQQKDYRNKIFITGFIAGCVAAGIVMSLFSATRQQPNPAGIPETQGTLAPNIEVPSNLQLTEPSSSPLNLQP